MALYLYYRGPLTESLELAAPQLVAYPPTRDRQLSPRGEPKSLAETPQLLRLHRRLNLLVCSDASMFWILQRGQLLSSICLSSAIIRSAWALISASSARMRFCWSPLVAASSLAASMRTGIRPL